MTTMVPSSEMQSTQPHNLPTLSSCKESTWASGLVNTVHRATNSSELSYEAGAEIHVRQRSAEEHNI